MTVELLGVKVMKVRLVRVVRVSVTPTYMYSMSRLLK